MNTSRGHKATSICFSLSPEFTELARHSQVIPQPYSGQLEESFQFYFLASSRGKAFRVNGVGICVTHQMLNRQSLDPVPQNFLAKQSRSLWCHKPPAQTYLPDTVICVYSTSIRTTLSEGSAQIRLAVGLSYVQYVPYG